MSFRKTGTLLLITVGAAQGADYKRYDGIHRVEKRAQVTEIAILPRADGDKVCGAGSKLCPQSDDGGCCPENYDCAKESCYATTSGVSSCGTKVGYYLCGPDAADGCCPNGYACQKDNCSPPSGAAMTQSCPTGRYLCPASMSGGCCPSGMACAINQCYSTSLETITSEIVITTTSRGDAVTITTETVTVRTPDAPTELPEGIPGDDSDDSQRVLKYYQPAVPKTQPTEDPDDDGGDAGLSKGALGGIIAGAVAFLIIVIVGAYIIIRHLNQVVAAVGSNSKQSSSNNSRPPMREFKPTDSEVDTFSVDPLMMPSRYQKGTSVGISDNVSSTDMTPSSFAGVYQPVSTAGSRHTSMETGNATGYFDNMPTTTAAARFSAQSASTGVHRTSADSQGTYTHLRHWSNASEASSDGGDAYKPGVTYNGMQVNELEARSIVPELPGSPSTIGSPRMGGMARPPATHQRMRSGTGELSELGVVDEEIHGYHGPTDRVTGDTREDSNHGWQR